MDTKADIAEEEAIEEEVIEEEKNKKPDAMCVGKKGAGRQITQTQKSARPKRDSRISTTTTSKEILEKLSKDYTTNML